MMKLLIPLALGLISQTANAAEVTIVPGDTLYLNPVNVGKNYQDLMVHTVLLSTSEGETFEVKSLSIELLSNGQVALIKQIPVDRLVGETQGLGHMVNQGMGVFLNAQILSADGLQGVLGYEPNFAASPALASNEFMILTRQHFSLDFKPDQVRIRATGINQDGVEEVAETSANIASYKATIEYKSPLKGAWMMTSLPSIQSHHRFNPPTEFAMDYFKPDESGKITAGGRLEADNYYGYGAEVMAAADGEVVFVISDEVQDRDALTRRDGESAQDAGRRIGGYNMRRYAADFPRAAAGNIIVIRHEAEGVTEYSSYGHLKAGSVQVKVGDVVTAGQTIAEVGDTGDSAEVHLHFQINTGGNPFFSQSLPFSFSNQQAVIRGLDPGRFVKVTE